MVMHLFPSSTLAIRRLARLAVCTAICLAADVAQAEVTSADQPDDYANRPLSVTADPILPPATAPAAGIEPAVQPTPGVPTTQPAAVALAPAASAQAVPAAGTLATPFVASSEKAASDAVLVAPASSPGTPIRRGSQPAASQAVIAPVSSGSTSDIVRVVGALGLVLALIFGAQWAGKRLLGQTRIGRSSRVINVLSRTMLGPRQQIMLVSVGRRVLVVGDSAGKLSPLAEITDMQEVAELLAETRGEKITAASAFATWMDRNQDQFEDDGSRNDSRALASSMDGFEGPRNDDKVSDLGPAKVGDLAGLLEKVRGVNRSFKS